MLITAIVLAAGAGTRFGGPKALARLDGKTWLEIAFAMLRDAGFARIVAIAGADADRVRREIESAPEAGDSGVIWAVNPDWERGRTGGLVRAIEALDAAGDTSAILIHAVDFPFVRPDTLRTLASAFRADPERDEKIYVPAHGGRRGHPILLGAALRPEVRALGADEPLSTVIRREAGRVVEVAVNDPGIHRNVNRPEDLGKETNP